MARAAADDAAELALTADVSSRHLSFIETGRSVPSRDMMLHLARQLNLPLLEQNRLLRAGGYAPQFSELALDVPRMDPVRAAALPGLRSAKRAGRKTPR